MGEGSGLTWLTEWSVEAVRQVLDRAAPGLADSPIVLDGPIDTTHPQWATGGAVIGGRYVAKFANSRATAARLWREARVLQLLGGRPQLHLPRVVAVSDDPVFFATWLVPGVPLSYGLVAAAIPDRVDDIGRELALFLATLHRPEILELVADTFGHPVPAPHPGPQATTAKLRHGFLPLIRPDQVKLVQRWCAWVDDVLTPSGEAVFVHGDFHGHNQVWDERNLRMRLVADFETCGAAEAEYDLRYVPTFGPGVSLLTATAGHYARLTGYELSLSRVMAWHVLSNLGEALWRGQAGLPLLLPIPGGGSPANYVDELSRRFDTLGIGPDHRGEEA